MDIQTCKGVKRDRARACGLGRSERGASMLELVLILPILLTLVFGVVDIGRLIHARLVITNVSREGGSLASRDIREGGALVTMLQASAAPFDLKNAQGRVWVTKIKAGTKKEDPEPYIESRFTGGSLVAASAITGSVGDTPGGLSAALFNHLRFDAGNNTSDISEVTVVEVFYLYRPITPLPQFVENLVLPNSGGMLVGSKAVF